MKEICEFIGMYHIVPTMIHWLYTVHANSIKYKIRRKSPRRRLIQNLHENNVNLRNRHNLDLMVKCRSFENISHHLIWMNLTLIKSPTYS